MKTLGPLIAAVFTAWAIQRVFQDAWRPASARGDQRVLRYGPALRTVGWFGGGVMPVVIAAMILSGSGVDTKEDLFAAYASLLALALFGWWIILETLRTYILFSGVGIEAHSLWRRVPTRIRLERRA